MTFNALILKQFSVFFFLNTTDHLEIILNLHETNANEAVGAAVYRKLWSRGIISPKVWVVSYHHGWKEQATHVHCLLP